jgi:tRNA isopentenyl-2-thiomethyl-A-37 hydroxylase MiaE
MYRALLASEARHHGVYLRLAETVAAASASERFESLAGREGEIARELVERASRTSAAVRLHN